jgi:hypothetical protein
MLLITLDLTKPTKALDLKIKSYPSIIAQSLFTSALNILVPEMRKNLKKNNNIFDGTLFQRIGVVAGAGAGTVWVDVGSIGVPYGLNIEKGQPPGLDQDLNKLIRYAKLKLGSKTPQLTGAKLKKSIEAKGTPAYPFALPAFKAREKDLVNDFIGRISI